MAPGPCAEQSSKSAFAGATNCNAMRTDLRSVSHVFYALLLARPTASTLRRQKTPRSRESPAPSAMPRFTTSITTAASSAGIALRLVPPTPSRMVTVSNSHDQCDESRHAQGRFAGADWPSASLSAACRGSPLVADSDLKGDASAVGRPHSAEPACNHQCDNGRGERAFRLKPDKH